MPRRREKFPLLRGFPRAPPKQIPGDMRTDADTRRKLSFKELSTALWNASEDEGNKGSYYAGGGDIAPMQPEGSILESVNVEGVGDLQLPLSSDDFLKLLDHRVCKKAPYGHGSATRLDPKVRRAWQVDASKVTFPNSPDFLSETVPLIVKKAVRALGMEDTVEAHLYKLLLYEPGGHFARHCDTEKEPGMFATLIILLPTQEGYEGGELVVHQGGTSKTFDFSCDSATKFFYSIFYADCEHELLKVTQGKRLCLSFNLVRGNCDSFNTPLQELIQKGYASRLSKVEAALEPWLQEMLREEPLKVGDAFHQSEKLAIPLQHKYTKQNLSFSGLKENDRICAMILQNCQDASGSRSLDLHLCILTLHQYGSADQETQEMDEVSDYDWNSSTWIDTNDTPCAFKIEINDQHEIVTDEEDVETLFTENAKPDEEVLEGYTGNEGPSVEYWYHKAMLVVWSRKKSLSIVCSTGVSCALDILETKAEEGDPAIVIMLHEVLNYCESKWDRKEPIVPRLMKLSLQVGGWESVLRVFKLLSKLGFQQVGYKASEGPIDTDTSTAISKAVQKHSWINCEPFIMELVTKDQVMVQGRHLSHLALELQRLGCEDAGYLVARRTLEMIDIASSSFNELHVDMVVGIGKLLFSFSRCMDEVGVKLLERFGQLQTKVLCSYIVEVYAMFQNKITQEAPSTEGSGVNCASLFKKACEIITTKDFHRPTPMSMSQSQIVQLVKTFIELGDEELIGRLIQAFLDQSRVQKQQTRLIAILSSDEIWTQLSETAFGRRKLKLLAEERIRVISEPVPFTWCMPLAQVPHHPAVEAFLRGPLEKLEYEGVKDARHATNFAFKYFDGTQGYQNGYSANAQRSYYRRPVCVIITKTRVAYDLELAQRNKEQQEELPRLRNRLDMLLTSSKSSHDRQATRKGDGLATRGNGSGNANEILGPHPSSEKRRKINKTEPIIILLSDDDE